MVQTSIGNTLAFGKPGEHGNSQPWVADPAIVKTAVNFGAPVIYDTDGTVKPATAAVCDGIAVSPNQHVRQVLPTDTASIAANVGDTIGIAKTGSWFIEIKGLSASPTLVKGVSGVKVASGAWAVAGSGDTPYATILDFEIFEKVDDEDTKTYDVGLLIRIN